VLYTFKEAILKSIALGSMGEKKKFTQMEDEVETKMPMTNVFNSVIKSCNKTICNEK